jgi:two-component system NtrC family sensor kinase
MKAELTNRRVLVIDDNESIHFDFRKILSPAAAGKAALANAAAEIFGEEKEKGEAHEGFEVDSATQGEEGLAKVRSACIEGRPYAMAFVDMRMPPGWDGVETIRRIWQEYPELQVVICTAYSDYSLNQIVGKLGRNDRLLVLKKPFDSVEVSQLANALTEKWRLERAARENIETLEERVAERTRELREGQQDLIEARKMELVGKLAGGIAHDFNSMLTAIIGHAELIAEAGGPEEVRMGAAEIRRAAAAAGRMTRQLLGFSRKQVRQAERLDVNALIASLEPKVRGMLGSGIEMSMVFNAKQGHTEVDAVQLEEVLLSLAENSRDAMPEGGQFIVETSNVSAAKGEMVLIAITDSGSGMTSEARERAFEPYFSTKAEGKGMSLAMCLGVVKQNGGEIELKGDSGRGTTFRILLPCVEVQEEKSETEEANPGTGVVLFVEGDAALRGVASTVLEAHGFTVYRAAGGREAISIAGRVNRIDLLVANTVMPEMTGKELAKWLCPLHPGIKTLFASSMGEGDCLHMPYTPGTLVSRTRAALAA